MARPGTATPANGRPAHGSGQGFRVPEYELAILGHKTLPADQQGGKKKEKRKFVLEWVIARVQTYDAGRHARLTERLDDASDERRLLMVEKAVTRSFGRSSAHRPLTHAFRRLWVFLYKW